MNRIIAGLLIAFGLTALSVLAQTQLPLPLQIEEFGSINSEDIQARLDGATIQLNYNPNSRLHFVFSRGEKDTFGSPYRLYGLMKTFLLSIHKVDPKKVDVSFCQPKPEKVGQIWLIDANGQGPRCEPENIVITKTTLFDSAPSGTGKGIGTCCSVDELGPAAAVESIRAFADLLKHYPESKAYVFAYGGTNIYWIGYYGHRAKPVRNLDTAKEIAALPRTARRILTEEGISPSRMIVKNAGYRDSVAQIDLWIVPPGGVVPKPSPNYRKKRIKK